VNFNTYARGFGDCVGAQCFATWEDAQLESYGRQSYIDIDIKDTNDCVFPSRGFLGKMRFLLKARKKLFLFHNITRIIPDNGKS
jgi:hypothetical protein